MLIAILLKWAAICSVLGAVITIILFQFKLVEFIVTIIKSIGKLGGFIKSKLTKKDAK